MSSMPLVSMSGVFREHYRNVSGWCSGRLECDNGDVIPCTLTYATSLDKCEIEGRGYWSTYKGKRQFRFVEVAPKDANFALSRVLVKHIDGIGERRAQKILNAWGENYWRHIGDPQMLETIGITGKAALKIAQSWKANRAKIQCYSGLLEMGLSISQAINVVREWGAETIEERLRHNPYDILRVPEVGWADAERIARQYGVTDPRDPRRLSAAAIEALNRLSKTGDTLHDREAFLRAVRQLVPGYPKTFQAAPDEIYYYNGHVAMRSLADAEIMIAERVKNTRFGVATSVVPDSTTLTQEQRDALHMLLRSDFGILVGAAGTGKTHTLATLVRYFWGRGHNLECIAPTARAIRNLSERTGIPGSTVHMSVYQNRLYAASVIIIEEASMMSTALMRRVLEQGQNARFILAGDPMQLPPVEPGQILRDLVLTSAHTIVAQLNTIIRHDGDLQEIAQAVRNNEWDFGSTQSVHTFVENAEDIVRKAVEQRLRMRDNPNVIVISGMRNEVAALNNALQAELNPRRVHPIVGGKRFAIGDPVRQTRNNYRLGVFNGQIGRITWIADDAHEVPVDEWDRRVIVKAEFDGTIIEYTLTDLDLTLAYAVTIHAAQGGEWETVIGIVPWHDSPYVQQNWLTRELLYTLITRAKQNLYLYATPQAREHFSKRANTWRERKTLLAELLRTT